MIILHSHHVLKNEMEDTLLTYYTSPGRQIFFRSLFTTPDIRGLIVSKFQDMQEEYLEIMETKPMSDIATLNYWATCMVEEFELLAKLYNDSIKIVAPFCPTPLLFAILELWESSSSWEIITLIHDEKACMVMPLSSIISSLAKENNT